ncbi:MAG TPA: prolyl oligopeptidase family serine peptidase [Candidatus Limnocylindria bacterium]|nr:prolyl oligopeptidase family serine peptidase [Candidatus Limnocylindria bacterium]
MTEAAWRRRFRAPRFSFPVWARDAPQRLVYGSDHEGTFEVYALDLASGVERRVTTRPEGTGYRVPSRIDPAGTTIWWWDDAGGSELGVWRTQPFDGERAGVATGLAPAYSTGLVVGTGFAIAGRSTDAGVEIHLCAEGGSTLLYAHREHARVVSLSTDERLVAIEHSEHGDSRNPAVRILDRAGAKVAELWDGPGKGLDARKWSPVRDDARLLVMHDRTGQARPLVYDVARGEEREVPLDLPGEVEASWYPDGRALLIEHEHRGRSELYRCDLVTGELARLPAPAGSIGTAAVRPDGDVWFSISTSAEPLSLRTVAGGRVLPRGEVDIPPGVPYRDVEAGQVHGFLAEPEGARPHPTIFIVHGGPEAHDTDSFSAGVQAWVDHGFAVACANYRGSTGYGKAWRDAIKGRPGLTELEDIAAVHDRLVNDGVADPRRSVISGASWGGYITLLALGVQPERWSLGIAGVPIGDYVAAFEDEMEPLKRYDAALFGGTPDEVPEVYRERNPITFVERVRVPAMLLVGRNDPRCPARSADLYVDRLKALGKPYELYQYEAGHGSLRLEERVRQVEAEIAFAAKHLGTAAPLA